MENLLSTSYTRWLVTVVQHFHQLKTGGHVSESEHIWPLLQIIGRGSVFSVWLRCCLPLGTSLHRPRPGQLCHYCTSPLLWAQLCLVIPSG